MYKTLLSIFIFTNLLFSSDTNDIWIDPSKKAILLDYAQDISEAKSIAKEYKNHDIYIYNTVQNSNACCAIHIVNIKEDQVNTLLKEVKTQNSSAKQLSKTRVKYFARDISPKNLFIEANSKKIIETKQISMPQERIKEVPVKQVIKDSLSQDTETTQIDISKKAILLEFVKNPKEAEILAQKYKNQDIYIHSTVKDQESCCAVYIVNIKQENLNKILKVVSKNSNKAKTISKSKIKYFASDISPLNKFISSSRVISEIIAEVVSTSIAKAKVKFNVKPNEKAIVKEIIIKKFNSEIIFNTLQFTPFIVPKTKKPHLFDKSKRALTVFTTSSLIKAYNIAKNIKEYDTYIHTSTITQTPYFVIYIANLDEVNYNNVLLKIKHKFPSTYITTQTKINYLINNNFNNENFTKASKHIVIEQPIVQEVKPPVKIIANIEKVIPTPIINAIDIKKRAVTIATTINLKKAKNIASKFNKYDIYIYKTTTTRVPYFIVYAVNIDSNNTQEALNTFRKTFKDAYASSKVRIQKLSENNFELNIFNKAVK
ncbi:MAG: hypothetical protein DRG78_09120 [Epsilonproteobacteria bacterium]|nr:MAG: hypothetical protein DRG78_09120 [Campylobacterota bacterium]